MIWGLRRLEVLCCFHKGECDFPNEHIHKWRLHVPSLSELEGWDKVNRKKCWTERADPGTSHEEDIGLIDWTFLSRNATVSPVLDKGTQWQRSKGGNPWLSQATVLSSQPWAEYLSELQARPPTGDSHTLVTSKWDFQHEVRFDWPTETTQLSLGFPERTQAIKPE